MHSGIVVVFCGLVELHETVIPRPYPLSGDTNTVLQSGVDLLEIDASPRFIPSLRMVVDVGEWDEARFVLPGGQSGNPLSPHYDDMLPLWRKGEGVPIAWSPDRVETATRKTLSLTPLPG